MRVPRTLFLSILLAGSSQAGTWSDLWYRRDQQAEHALQAGDAKRAAELFEDPRRQAYAQLQSNQNGAAAKRLESFTDANSQYNRGNALAKAGDLQGALKAYEDALKHVDLEPSLHRDAQRNRDLVARQLQAQKDHEQASSSGKQQKNDDKGKAGSNDSKESSGASGSSGSTSPPAAAKSSGTPQSESGKSESGKETNTSAATPSSQSGGTKPAAGDERRAAQETSRSAADVTSASARSSQPQLQAGSSARQEQSPGSTARAATEPLNARQAMPGDVVKPQSEQQIALDQWLRQIPDDPGGLLRRKFIIEHWLKQQQQQGEP